MRKLADVLEFDGIPERITTPSNERFVTVRLNYGGAIERKVAPGKTPVAFTGYRVHSGQFIYSRIDARNGAFAIVPDELEGAVVSKDFPVFKVREDRVDARYLTHFFRSGHLEREIRARSRGATNRQRISEEEFLSFDIRLPSVAEQCRIAAILDRVVRIQANRVEIIQRLEGLREAIFDGIFGTPSSWASRWSEVTIGQVASSVDYGTSAKAGASGTFPILRMGNVTDSGGIDTSDLKYLDLASKEVDRYTTRQGDLLFNRTNSAEKVGKTGLVRTDERYAIAGYLVRLRLTDAANPEFVCAFLNGTHGRRIRRGLAKEAINQANISAGELKRIRMPLPPIQVQNEFADIMSAVEAQRENATALVEQDRQLFVSLQSRAFRGEL